MSLQTSAAFRQYYLDGRAPLVRAVLRLADDTTVQVGGDRIMVGGLSVTGATSPASDFSIGSAIVGTATVTLANYDGWLDLLDLEGATLLAYAGAEVAGGTEWALLGTYDVDAPTTRGMTYPLQCRDWMGRFEVAYSEVTTAYPATLATIVSDICSHVGITLATTTFTNSTHVVQARPTDELSCIDMLGFVAQLACSYARMTPDGRLSLGWYDPDAFGGSESWLDGGTFSGSQTPYADGDAANGGAFMTGGDTANGGSFDSQGDYSQVSAIRSLTTGAMDVTITGLRVTAQDEVVTEGEGAEGESYQYGQDGYVLAIEGNPLVPYGSAQAVAAMVAPYVVGLSFRPLDSDVIGDPSLQAGDAMVVTDRLGRTYRTYVTQATWSSGGSQRLACGAQAPSRRAMSRTGVVTRAIKAVNDAVRRVTTATQAARQVADEAKSVADAIGQHFWTGDDGVHVTQVTQESWETTPVGPNLLANSLGILLRTGLSNLVSVTQGAIAFYDGLGNAAANVVAQFGRDGAYQYVQGALRSALTSAGLNIYASDGSTSVAKFGTSARIGALGGGRVEVDSDGLDVYGYANSRYARIATLNNPSTGLATIGVTGVCVSITESSQGGSRTYVGIWASSNPIVDVLSAEIGGQPVTVVPQGNAFECPSASVGDVLTVSYTTSAVVGSTVLGSNSHAEGDSSLASGAWCDASGYASQAFGESTANGDYSHAEGNSETFGTASHSEGYQTKAIGDYSHAGGYDSEASGRASTAIGTGTKASSENQATIGRYNVEDTQGKYALVVGNGSPSNRSNALAVGWDGGLYVNNHTGAIGELVTTDISTAVSVATADYTTIGSITLTTGVWVVKYNAIFANNATGRRAIVLSTSSDSAGSGAEQRSGMASQMAVSGMGTVMCNDRIISAAGTYRLNVYQNSGSALNVTGYIRAVRIA